MVRGAALQRGEIFARRGDDFARHAGELRHREAVTTARRAFLHGMQEDDPVTMLGGIEMHVGAALDLAGETGELEVVSREQGEGTVDARDVARHRPGQRQTIEGAGAAAYL